MSCLSWCILSEEAQQQRRVNREIEKQLAKDRIEYEREIKLFSLGAEGSGKSTFMKQMRIIYGEGYSSSDRQNFVVIIHRNIYIAMQQLLEAMKHLKIPYQTELPEGTSNILSIKPDVAQQITPEVKAMMAAVWRDGGIQMCFSRRREFKISDSAKYYLDDLDRITAEEYLPTQQDILNAYVHTTGFNEYIFTYSGLRFRMMDFGRSFWRSWLRRFGDFTFTGIMFFVALSEYDQSSWYEEFNQMKENLDLFSSIIRSPWFSRYPVILLFNKIDLFEERIMTSHLVDYFPEYTGPKCDHVQAQEFIAKLFINASPERSTDIYPHFVCATDTEHMKLSFNSLVNCTKNHILVHHLLCLTV